MEQSISWEAKSFSANQNAPHTIYVTRSSNTAFTRARNLYQTWARLVPSTSCLKKIYIHSNIIILSILSSSKCYLSARHRHQNPACICPLPHTCHMSRQSHTSIFNQPNFISWWYSSWGSTLSKFLQSSALTAHRVKYIYYISRQQVSNNNIHIKSKKQILWTSFFPKNCERTIMKLCSINTWLIFN